MSRVWDRISNGVYRVLSIFFAPLLHKVFKASSRKGQLPTTMLEGDITLLFKKNEIWRSKLPTTNHAQHRLQDIHLNHSRETKNSVLPIRSRVSKGFIPKTFISECSMLLHLVEAWISDEPTTREGLLIFLDKALWKRLVIGSLLSFCWQAWRL